MPGDFNRHPTTGAPYIAHPETGKKKQYGRASSATKELDDDTALQKWIQRRVLLGAVVSDEVYKMVQDANARFHWDEKEWKDAMDEAIEKALIIAKARIAAERGTYAHSLIETDEHDAKLGSLIGQGAGTRQISEDDVKSLIAGGMALGVPVEEQDAIVRAWRAVLREFGLEVLTQEHRVVADRWRLAGTLDAIFRLRRDLKFRMKTGEIITLPAGLTICGDFKSGLLRRDPKGMPLYWDGYCGQVTAYANSVPYDPDTDLRGEWPADWGQMSDEWAIIVHISVQEVLSGEETTAELVLVDIRQGIADLDLARQLKDNRKVSRFGVLGPDEPLVVINKGGAKEEQAPTVAEMLREDSPIELGEDW